MVTGLFPVRRPHTGLKKPYGVYRINPSDPLVRGLALYNMAEDSTDTSHGLGKGVSGGHAGEDGV